MSQCPWGRRGWRGRSSGLVPRPGRLPSVRLCGWDVSSGSAHSACHEPPAAHPDPFCLSALQERSLTGYLAWRKGAEQTMSLHRMTPAGPLTTPSGWKSSKESSFLSWSPSKEASVPRVPLTQKTAHHGSTQCAQHSCDHPSSPLGTLFPLGFLLGGIFHPSFKNHTDQHRYFSLTDFEVQIFETGQWYRFFLKFFFSFEKLLWFCCYTKNRDLHCMVLDLFKFWWGKGVILE